MRNKIALRLKQAKKELLSHLPRRIGNESIKAFRSHIDRGVDVNGTAFKSRSPDFRPGGQVLYQRGKLLRSIRVKQANAKRIVIAAGGSAAPYAKIHNEGGTIPITPKMRKFFWAMYYKELRKTKTRTGKQSKSKRAKEASWKVKFWRGMAFRTKPIKIPKRQYIGDGKSLRRAIRQAIRDSVADIKR